MLVAAVAVTAQLWLGTPAGNVAMSAVTFGASQLTSAVSVDGPPRYVGSGAVSGTSVVGMPISGLPRDRCSALARSWSAAVNAGAPILTMLSLSTSAATLLPSEF